MDDNNQDNQNQQNDIADKLSSIKVRTLNELLSLLPNLEGLSKERQFEIYLSALPTANDTSIAEHALESAMAIEDKTKKAECLSELVDEIDYKLATL